jgi:Cu(I)/Ag(I) efflux system membrane fusion protein
MSTLADPIAHFSGRVDYIYPELDPTTHTLRVRVVVPNPELLLKANMYVSARLQRVVASDALSIPRQSVIRGEHGDHVIVALGEGRFTPRAVRLGELSGDRAVVLEGLRPGERVVANGIFFIDSESDLQSAFARMQAGTAPRGP